MNKNIENPLDLLIDLGISTKDSVELYFPHVRDNKNVQVFRCNKSGVKFLSSIDHLKPDYYKKRNNFEYWNELSLNAAKSKCFTDDYRRSQFISEIITNKSWLDIGTGAGGILDLANHKAKETHAVEMQEDVILALRKSGYNVYNSINDVQDNSIDVATLFHVFEHFINPIKELINIHSKLSKNGMIIIEVPHANDFLMNQLDLTEFKGFTLWSEHIYLHTRHSLSKFLEKCGFKNIIIKGIQRYSLANHLYWLKNKCPGGHLVWPHLKNNVIDSAYETLLSSIDQTDTLIATATK